MKCECNANMFFYVLIFFSVTGTSQEYSLKIQGNFEMGEEMTTLVRAIYDQIFQKKSEDQGQGLSLNLGDFQAQFMDKGQEPAQGEVLSSKILNDLSSDNKIYAIHESQHGRGDEAINNIHTL